VLEKPLAHPSVTQLLFVFDRESRYQLHEHVREAAATAVHSVV
jgi:hypothetical protein